MITLLIVLFGLFLAMGVFFIVADYVSMPTIATEKAIISASNRDVKADNIDATVGALAVKLSKYIRINEYKRIRLKNVLIAAGISHSPEEYTANCIMKGLLIALISIPMFLIFPIIAPICIIGGIMVYFKEIGKADEIMKEKREKIESQLPRFCATITQELKNSRDVLSILENFKHNANEEFASELDILTADMRSASYETALTRCEARINSTILSDITRGLIGVLRGDDGSVYFQMLSHDLKALELQKLKAEAMKIPPKIKKYSFLMLMCFLMTYLVIIVFEIILAMGSMFG